MPTSIGDLAAALRDAADALDRLPEIECRPSQAFIYLHDLSPSALATLARHFGKARKEANGDSFWLSVDFGLVRIACFARDRDEVCRRVVKGTRRVPTRVIPAHDEEIVEWECDPLLAHADREAVA